jgi:ankyrin repeat protein
MRKISAMDNKKENNYLEVFKLLLEYGADINLKNKEGYSALNLSIIFKNNTISCLLVNNGADINICSKYYHNPLLYSLYIKNYFMIKFLFNNGAKYNITNINKPLYIELDTCIILYNILNKKNIDICWIILELLVDIEYIDIIKTFFYNKMICYKN